MSWDLERPIIPFLGSKCPPLCPDTVEIASSDCHRLGLSLAEASLSVTFPAWACDEARLTLPSSALSNLLPHFCKVKTAELGVWALCGGSNRFLSLCYRGHDTVKLCNDLFSCSSKATSALTTPAGSALL